MIKKNKMKNPYKIKIFLAVSQDTWQDIVMAGILIFFFVIFVKLQLRNFVSGKYIIVSKSLKGVNQQ